MTISPENSLIYYGKDLEAMSFAENYHEWIMAEIAPFIGDYVAEVGAGTGDFSKLLINTGLIEIKCFEPSINMYPFLENALEKYKNACAINGFFDGLKFEGCFDSVLYINVLEHIEDDASELINAYHALKKNGLILLFVPAMPCLYSKLDKQMGHYRRYLKRDLVAMVESVGLKVEQVKYFDVFGILPWYINFVLLKSSIGGGSVSLYDRIIVPPMRILEGFIHKPLVGKNLFLVARK